MYDIVLLSDGEYMYPVTTQEEFDEGLEIGFHAATDKEYQEWVEDDLPPITIH